MTSLITVILSTTVWFVKIAFLRLLKRSGSLLRNRSEHGLLRCSRNPPDSFFVTYLRQANQKKGRKKESPRASVSP